MSEVAKITDQSIKQSPELSAPHDNPVMTLLERVLLDPNLPIERVTAIMDMQERQMNKMAEQAFNSAFAAAMADMTSMRKSGNSNTGCYSTLDDLVSASRPALSKHGLALNWKSTTDGNVMTVTAIIRHKEGWREENSKSANIDAGKGPSSTMNAIQASGSTETYLKRYTGFGILGMSSQDHEDDGASSASKNDLSTINEQQFLELKDLLEKANLDEETFLKAWNANPGAVLAEFPAAWFNQAKQRLNKRISAMEAK